MKLLEEARTLAQSDEKSLHKFLRLVELRRQAHGDEAAQIGLLVEDFINSASPQVVLQISALSRS